MAPPNPSERFRRVRELFGEALEAPADAREALLERAAASDRALAEEVRQLLAAHDRDGRFVEQIVAAEAEDLVAEASPAGRRIGAYEVLRSIGSGGMGAVFLARRADAEYEAQVALKIVRPGLFSPETLRRFRAERQALARLSHPAIARLLDGGTTPDGLPYLVMEHVEGLPIEEFVQTRGLDLDARLRLFQSVCEGVGYAHRNLIVHRDLKPAHILVTPAGEAKLLDFGIAKFLGEEEPGLTRVGERILTPDFASPEQIRGEPVTTATDVYSLGVVLYRLITGRHPYRFETGRVSEIERVVCETPPDRPSAGEAPWRRRLPGDIENIVLKALAKEPERRYASVGELSEDVRRFLDGEPVRARQVTWAYRARKFLARHRGAVAAAALVAVSLLAGALLALRSAQTARLEARKADQINAFVRAMLGAASPWRDGSKVTVAEVVEGAAGRIGAELSGQPEVEAGVRLTVGETYAGLGMYEKAEEQIELALARLRDAGRPGGAEEADALMALATSRSGRGDAKGAEAPVREALAIRQSLHGDRDASVASSLAALGGVLQAQGRLDEAETAGRRAIEIFRQTAPGSSGLAEALNNLAVTLGTRGDLRGAEPFQRESLEIVRRIHRGKPHPDVASAMSALASTVWDGRRDAAEAEPLYRDTLAMRRELLGAEHPDVAWTLYNYAYMLMEQGQYARAEALAREALANRGRTLPDEHPMVAATLQVVGRCRLNQRDPAGAEPLLRESLALRQRSLPPDHWLLAASRSILGESLRDQGRLDEARPMLSESYEVLKAKLGPDNPRTREAAARLGARP